MVETILKKIPFEMMEKINRRRGNTGEPVTFGTDPPSELTLTRLHRQVFKTAKVLYE